MRGECRVRLPRCGKRISSSKFRPDPPVRARTIALPINIGFGARSEGRSLGAMGTGLSWELGADDIDDSLDAEPLVAAADTGEVSGRLGPLLANVFQNQEGVNFDAPLRSGLVVLELRDPSPAAVLDPAFEEPEIVDCLERIDDCEGEVPGAPDCSTTERRLLDLPRIDSSSSGGK